MNTILVVTAIGLPFFMIGLIAGGILSGGIWVERTRIRVTFIEEARG